MMMAQTQALAAMAQGLQAKSVFTSRPSSPRRDAYAEFDASNGITHGTGSANTSFTATPRVKDRKFTRLANTLNMPTAPAHTAGLRKWRRDFCRYLDANASGIGPLVCPDLYDATTPETFDRTAMACAVEAIRMATSGTRAEDVLDDIDDEDVDPATLMERVVAYITGHDSDSSLVLERELESIAPVSTGTRVEQIDQVYKDVKDMERRYRANGLVRGADYFITRARLLIALHYPELTFSMDRSFRTLKGLFGEYHHRAADADELEQRTAASGGASADTGAESSDEDHEHADRDQSGGGDDGGNKTDYKKGHEAGSARLADAEAALTALQGERLAEAEAALMVHHAKIEAHKATMQDLQATLDTNEALLATCQAQGCQHDWPEGPP